MLWMKRIRRLIKKMKAEDKMAKDERKKGRSARNGNAPAPYTKYNKKPYQYSPAYYAWNRAVKSGGARPIEKPRVERPSRHDMLQAAE